MERRGVVIFLISGRDFEFSFAFSFCFFWISVFPFKGFACLFLTGLIKVCAPLKVIRNPCNPKIFTIPINP